VNANLELECIRFPLLKQFTIRFTVAIMRQSTKHWRSTYTQN
jgi:hypothetical protein